MVDDSTSSIQATCSRTRIHAFLIQAGFVQRTLWAYDTFWTTSRRGTDVVFLTRTDCVLIYFATFTIWSTRWRSTGVHRNWFGYYKFVRKNFSDHFQAINREKHLLFGISWQTTEGLPVNPAMQEHIGAWLETKHSALTPHIPGQGSLHLLFRHDRVLGQSAFKIHSGLHSW